jgi:hypothetical protein
MRDFVIFGVIIVGALWACDEYTLGGRYSRPIWQQTISQGRAYKNELERHIDRAMSGKCIFCD